MKATSRKEKAVPATPERSGRRRPEPITGVRASRGRTPASPPLRLVPGRESRRDAVRWPRVRTAKQRIESGYYEREDVRHLVVNALLNELRRG